MRRARLFLPALVFAAFGGTTALAQHWPHWRGPTSDGVSLETATFEDLGGRTRVTTTSLVDSFEARDGILASGMDVGVREGYERLDELLARTS